MHKRQKTESQENSKNKVTKKVTRTNYKALPTLVQVLEG